jgi:hypothetical protein
MGNRVSNRQKWKAWDFGCKYGLFKKIIQPRVVPAVVKVLGEFDTIAGVFVDE